MKGYFAESDVFSFSAPQPAEDDPYMVCIARPNGQTKTVSIDRDELIPFCAFLLGLVTQEAEEEPG